MNTDKEEYIKSLEERIEKLEKLFEHLCINQCKEITLTNCSLGDIRLGDNCNITANSCPVGGVIPDIEDAENRVDELEWRIYWLISMRQKSVWIHWKMILSNLFLPESERFIEGIKGCFLKLKSSNKFPVCRSIKMIKEIFSFGLYEGFIRAVSDNSIFADPHFEFDNSNLYDSLKKENRKAHIVTEGEQVNGLFVWLILPDEKYIEMLIGLSKEESSIQEMLKYIEDKYRGYQLDFVINPQHYLFRKLLQAKNAEFEEEQQWMVWEKEIENQYQHEVVLLTEEYEAQYIDKHSKDTYWTAEKVIKAKDRFRVFLAIHEGKVVGYIDVTYCYEKNEPYDIWVDDEFQDKGYEQALLLAAIKMNKPNKMMTLVGVDNNVEIEMLKSVGFVPVAGTNSVYVTYKS